MAGAGIVSAVKAEADITADLAALPIRAMAEAEAITATHNRLTVGESVPTQAMQHLSIVTVADRATAVVAVDRIMAAVGKVMAVAMDTAADITKPRSLTRNCQRQQR
jgi:hypothetical protein